MFQKTAFKWASFNSPRYSRPTQDVVKPKGRRMRLQYEFPLNHLLLTYLPCGNRSRTFGYVTLDLELSFGVTHILANNQLDALFHVFIYFISLHVSSTTVLIIRRSNCINTSYGTINLCKWLLGMPVRRKLQFPPDRHTKQLLTQINHTKWCINTIRSPDDEHCGARSM